MRIPGFGGQADQQPALPLHDCHIACLQPPPEGAIAMDQITLRQINKRFGNTAVLQDVTLSVEPSTFLALLGPSGCGKTTLLRLIAGLERPTSGEIEIAGRVVAGPDHWVETEARKLGMVFQSYALWPHMSVAENVGFGLSVRGMHGRERAARVEAALAMVGLEGLGSRRPPELSGGQRQRTALARCLVTEPELILLDEPLANLDPHLRESMQAEFRRIHRKTGTTFVFVTHDQAEAMALADRVAVMNAGRIEQLGTPQELYGQPATRMVAEFFGKGVVLPVDVAARLDDRTRRVSLGGVTLDLPGVAAVGAAQLSLRPENVVPAAAGLRPHLVGRVVDTSFRGADHLVTLALEQFGGKTIGLGMAAAPEPGARVDLAVTGGWVLPA